MITPSASATPSNATPALNDTLAMATYQAFSRAYTAKHQNFLATAKKCNDFYMGRQWDDKVKRALEAKGFPALTLNQIYSIYSTIRGFYSTQQADFIVKARRRGATSETADILTRLIDIVLDDNNYHTEVEPQLFDDGNIETRGYLDVRMNYDDNVLGEIKITTLDPRMVVIDPDAKDYDPETWGEVFIERWMSFADIEGYYGGDAATKLKANLLAGQILAGENIAYHDASDTTFGGSRAPLYGSVFSPVMMKQIRAIRVIERQHRAPRKVRELVSLTTGDTRVIPPHVTPEQVQALTKTYNLAVRERTASAVRWSVTADSVQIFDQWSDMDHFTVLPYFPVFRRGESTSPIAHLLDPQEFYNKLQSQSLRSINSMANSGWQYEAGTLVNMTDEEFKQNSSRDGVVVVRRKNSAPVEKIAPNPPPSGLDRAGREIFQSLRDISGVEALLGSAPSAELAGVTLEKSQSAATNSLQMVFDNLQRTRRLLGDRIVDLIQEYYSEPRVFQAADIDLDDAESPEEAQKTVAINVQAVGKILHDVTLGEYQLNVATAPRRDTANDAQFAQMVALRNAGIAIPDYRIIERSNIHGRDRMAEESKRQQGYAPPSESDAQLQQLQLRQVMAQVADMEAKVQKTLAEAREAEAKAQSLGADVMLRAGEAHSTSQLEAEKLIADLQKMQMNLGNKLELAKMHIAARESHDMISGAQRRATQASDQAHEQDLEQAKMMFQAITGGSNNHG